MSFPAASTSDRIPAIESQGMHFYYLFYIFLLLLTGNPIIRPYCGTSAPRWDSYHFLFIVCRAGDARCREWALV